MGEWEDVFGSNSAEYYGKEDDPNEIWSHLDKTCYQNVLMVAKLGLGFHMLIIENHVFKTFEEAANAARELAKKTQSTVKIFTDTEKDIYSIYDPEMAAVIKSVQRREIDDWFYPKSPLIRLRGRDIIYHENKGNWLFVAHPNGKTENLERNLLACIRDVLHLSFYPFGQIQVDNDWKFSKRPVILNRSLKVATINERDDILKRASRIAKARNIEVYVVRLREELDDCGIHNGSSRYVVFTEEKLSELIKKHIEFKEKYRINEEQKINKRKELDDYMNLPVTIELMKNAKTIIFEILGRIISCNMDVDTYDDGIVYGRSRDKFYPVITDNIYALNGKGIFQLIHVIMCEEGIYKSILSDKQHDGIDGVIADHPEDVYRHAGICECDKLKSILAAIYMESIAYTVKLLEKNTWCGCLRVYNYRINLDEDG